MKKTIFVLTLISAILISSLIGVLSVDAQFLGDVYINPDGSVTGTNKIQRNENSYTLTGNISGGIQIQKSHIVLDGAGYAFEGNGEGAGIDLSNGRGQDPSRIEINNVTVKNLKILNFNRGVDNANTNNNTFVGNYVVNCPESGFWIIGSLNNNITGNTLNNAIIAINYAGSNSITRNNFIDCWVSVWLSTQPVVDGNYWNDYAIRYPDSKEIGNTGVWDTPYEYWDTFVDNHPLTKPIAIPAFPDVTCPVVSVVSPENKNYNSSSVSLVFKVDEPTIWVGYSLDGRENVTVSGNTTISGLPNGLHSLRVFANDTFGNMGASEIVSFTVAVPEPFPTLVVAITIAVVAVVVLGLLVYLKKRYR